MAKKEATIGLQRDYKKFLYYVDGEGNVCAKPKDGGDSKVLVKNAVTRETGFLYFIDKDGDVSSSPMARRGAAKV